MAYISGEYTSATEYTITLGGMAIGTVYAILVQDINTDGSSNGFICKWKSGATSSTHTVKYTTTAVYSQYDRRIGFFQGSFNTNVGTVVSDTNFDAWADGESVIEAWSGGGGGTTYTIAVNANGGTYSGPTPTVSSSYPYLSLTAISNSTSRSGYKLMGWLWSVDGVVYSTTAMISGISSSGTLTAQWKYNGNYYYQVRVNANGGKFSNGDTFYWWPKNDVASSESQSPTVDTSEFDIPTRTGYKFVGWSSSPSATSGADYITFKALSTDADDPTTGNNAYAIWSQLATITFNYNGGRYGESAGPQSVYAALNSNFEINRTPTKSGWNFAGWERTYSTGTTITYPNGSVMVVDEMNITLKALWSRRIYFRIASSSEGVSSYEVRINGSVAYTWTNTSYSSTYSVLYEEGTRIELRPIPLGIYEGSTLVNANGFDTPLLTAATSESGTGSTSMSFRITTTGTVLTLPVYTPFNITSAISNSGYSYFSILSLAKSYTCKLYANNGTWISGTNPKTTSIKSTQKLNLSSYTTLTRGNYGLLGWHTSSSSNIPKYRTSDSFYLTGDLNLYAVWGKYLYIKCGKGTQTVKIVVGSYLNSQTSNSTGYTSFLFPESTTIQLTVQLFSGYEVPVKLKFSATASGTIVKTSKITSGNSISFSYPGDGQRYIEVIASAAIDYFTWCGSDNADNTKIKKGQPVSNLTAEAWNRLKAILNLMLDRMDITSVSVGSDVGKVTITATEFNKLQEALLQLKVKLGYTGLSIPQKVSKNNPILASYFNGTGSLKDATNKIRAKIYS